VGERGLRVRRSERVLGVLVDRLLARLRAPWPHAARGVTLSARLVAGGDLAASGWCSARRSRMRERISLGAVGAVGTAAGAGRGRWDLAVERFGPPDRGAGDAAGVRAHGAACVSARGRFPGPHGGRA
jgi:hypothetical protein